MTDTAMTAGNGNTGFKLTGWHVLAAFVAFFGVVIAVNITMATFAVKNWTGLVVKNSYVASQSFNEDLAAARAQNALGYVDTLTWRDGVWHWSLATTQGTPVLLKSAVMRVNRPVGEDHDATLDLSPTATGGVEAKADKLGDGRWLVRIEAMLEDGTTYHVRRAIVVQDGVVGK